MVRTTLAAAAFMAGSALALPAVKRANLDYDILNFALTLEHLENYFYDGALKKLSQADFQQAGKLSTSPPMRPQADVPPQATLRTTTTTCTTSPTMSRHTLPRSRLPSLPPSSPLLRPVPTTSPTPPCMQYPPALACARTDSLSSQQFITLSSIIENVGTSAYLGAAPLITSKGYLGVAGAILAVEALHTSYQRAAIGEVPMQNAFQTVRFSPKLAARASLH